MQNNIVVVGGSNIDICAKSGSNIVLHDSNIGHVEFGLGGVGRNIAEELCLFGADVSLLTAVGDDSFGRVAIDRADELGLNLLAEPFENEKTGVYAYVSDNDGSFVLGVNDMGITDKISPQIIDENINALYFADCVVIEANLSVETIEKIASYDLKIIADSVSGRKCRKLLTVLDKLYLLKCNRIEAFEMTGASSIDDAVKEFVKLGVKRGIITLGSEGAMCYEATSSGIVSYRMGNMPKEPILDANGCGDAFLSGFVFGLMRGHSMKESLTYGQAAAYLNAQSLASVNREMDYSMLKKTIKKFTDKVETEVVVIR